jgi:hypothetical protein
MHIQIIVRVSDGEYLYGSDVAEKEVTVKLDQAPPVPELPWDQICAGLVEAAIDERLAAAEPTPTLANEE